jgi:cytochrome c biogenesis protein CcmG/thiol:disulfide interchange protein DsbE
VLSRRISGLALSFLVLVMSVPVRADMPDGLGEVTGKVVWVDFWASWCAPCRRSFPWMNEMLERYEGQGLQIIGVNVDKEMKLAEEFLAETPAKFDLRYDPAGALAEKFGVQAMPSSFLLDANGNVIATHFGFRSADAEDYEATIVKALGQAARSN